MWVLGGCDWSSSPNNFNDVWYSSDGVSWNKLPDTPWHIRHAASVFVYKDALWIVAGSHLDNDVWKLADFEEKT